MGAQKSGRDREQNVRAIQDRVDVFVREAPLASIEVHYGFTDVHALMGQTRHTEMAYVRVDGRRVDVLFHDLLLDRPESTGGFIFLAKSWVLLPILDRIAHEDGTLGRADFVFEIGDGGPLGQVCFSSTIPDACMIFDYDFAANLGYQSFRNAVAEHAVTWDQRVAKVFWRGSSTGARIGEAPAPGQPVDPLFRWLQRLNLSATVRANPWLREHSDIGVSAIVQIDEPHLVESIHAAGLIGERVPREHFMKFKAVIDVDGNASAWSGLFCSLLGGSLVFKADGPPRRRYYQWYYKDMIPWFHYIPLAYDFSDLPEKVEWLMTHDRHAAEIAARGQELAQSITMEHALEHSMRSVRRLIASRS